MLTNTDIKNINTFIKKIVDFSIEKHYSDLHTTIENNVIAVIRTIKSSDGYNLWMNKWNLVDKEKRFEIQFYQVSALNPTESLFNLIPSELIVTLHIIIKLNYSMSNIDAKIGDKYIHDIKSILFDAEIDVDKKNIEIKTNLLSNYSDFMQQYNEILPKGWKCDSIPCISKKGEIITIKELTQSQKNILIWVFAEISGDFLDFGLNDSGIFNEFVKDYLNIQLKGKSLDESVNELSNKINYNDIIIKYKKYCKDNNILYKYNNIVISNPTDEYGNSIVITIDIEQVKMIYSWEHDGIYTIVLEETQVGNVDHLDHVGFKEASQNIEKIKKENSDKEFGLEPKKIIDNLEYELKGDYTTKSLAEQNSKEYEEYYNVKIIESPNKMRYSIYIRRKDKEVKSQLREIFDGLIENEFIPYDYNKTSFYLSVLDNVELIISSYPENKDEFQHSLVLKIDNDNYVNSDLPIGIDNFNFELFRKDYDQLRIDLIDPYLIKWCKGEFDSIVVIPLQPELLEITKYMTPRYDILIKQKEIPKMEKSKKTTKKTTKSTKKVEKELSIEVKDDELVYAKSRIKYAFDNYYAKQKNINEELEKFAVQHNRKKALYNIIFITKSNKFYQFSDWVMDNEIESTYDTGYELYKNDVLNTDFLVKTIAGLSEIDESNNIDNDLEIVEMKPIELVGFKIYYCISEPIIMKQPIQKISKPKESSDQKKFFKINGILIDEIETSLISTKYRRFGVGTRKWTTYSEIKQLEEKQEISKEDESIPCLLYQYDTRIVIKDVTIPITKYLYFTKFKNDSKLGILNKFSLNSDTDFLRHESYHKMPMKFIKYDANEKKTYLIYSEKVLLDKELTIKKIDNKISEFESNFEFYLNSPNYNFLSVIQKMKNVNPEIKQLSKSLTFEENGNDFAKKIKSSSDLDSNLDVQYISDTRYELYNLILKEMEKEYNRVKEIESQIEKDIVIEVKNYDQEVVNNVLNKFDFSSVLSNDDFSFKYENNSITVQYTHNQIENEYNLLELKKASTDLSESTIPIRKEILKITSKLFQLTFKDVLYSHGEGSLVIFLISNKVTFSIPNNEINAIILDSDNLYNSEIGEFQYKGKTLTQNSLIFWDYILDTLKEIKSIAELDIHKMSFTEMIQWFKDYEYLNEEPTEIIEYFKD